MRVVRRRLFWKIYATLLASLVATGVFMGAFFWFLGEAQREGAQPAGAPMQGGQGGFGQGGDVSLYAGDGTLIGARGRPVLPSDYGAGRRRGPDRVQRIDLPDGRFVLVRFEPSARARALGIIAIMLVVVGGVGLAAYPVTALLTRRLEALRFGMERWGEGAAPVQLDDRGQDEVALLATTFNAATARLAALVASQKALLANASHELRSPLARLRIAIDGGPRDAAGAYRAEIVKNLAEMDQLVDELLLSSRLDHPATHRDRREPIDLLGLAAEEAARCDASVSGEPVEIAGDPVLLRRLIRNLLENAVKHGRPPVAVTVARRGDGVEIVVSDGGAGIAAAERERVFEPFYRPAGSREASGGWGLGLTLVRQIAERHGGSVTCGEAPGGGSRFVVRLQPAFR